MGCTSSKGNAVTSRKNASSSRQDAYAIDGGDDHHNNNSGTLSGEGGASIGNGSRRGGGGSGEGRNHASGHSGASASHYNNGSSSTGGGGGSNGGMGGSGKGGRYATCHFCHRNILEKDLNAHTVMCSEREVTCWNSWCHRIMRQADLAKHMEECSRQQKTMCPKCGVEIRAVEMQAHRETCQPRACAQCGELCITRIHKWCPQLILSKVTMRCGPFATEALLAKYMPHKAAHPGGTAVATTTTTTTPAATAAAAAAAAAIATLNNNSSLVLPGANMATVLGRVSYNVARVQLLWRWVKCRALIEETIFRSVHKEMDLKKEGFAIFKAHDKANESHVLAPKRSRSVIQAPVVAPATSTHYFPVNTNTPITAEHVERLIKDIKNRVLLPYPAAWRVFMDAMNHLNTLPNVVRLSPPVGARVVNGRIVQGCKVIVVGDLHGQIGDLLHILHEYGLPNESNYYVFNGDFVDRGPCSVEVLLILFSLMLAFPTCVTLNRGNHECDYMNDEYGFDVEVSTKYDRNVFRLIQRCFCALPLATILAGKVFIVHGGLPRRKGVTINDLSRIQRFRQIPIPDNSQPEEDEIFQDLLWSDPVEDITGWRESQRGAGVEFGADLTEEFLRNNKLELVLRSHEECVSGYQEHHNRRLMTVFSASNYDGPDTNYGAVCAFIGDNTEPNFYTYQVFESEYEDPQLMALVDSMALTTPNVPRIGASFTALTGGVASAAAAALGGHYGGNGGGGGVLHSSSAALATTLTSASMMTAARLLRRRSKDDVLRELRERIYQRRHRLMAYYSKLDRTNKGSLWMIEWVDCMRNVLNLDLPWYFLRSYLVEVDEHSRIWYSPFLARFHNLLQSLWLDDWKQTVCARIVQQQRANHRSRLVSAAFNKETVSYYEFCSVLRAIDYTISDVQLFQLFELFDVGGKGHVSGPYFIKTLQMLANAKPDPLRWDIDAMEQLQNIVIQGRSQLPSLFRVSVKDKMLSREKFMSGMAQLARGMRKQLTQPQKDAIYDFMLQRSSPDEGVSFDTFLLFVYVFDSRTVTALRLPSISDMTELGLPPVYFKNSSFSSAAQAYAATHSALT